MSDLNRTTEPAETSPEVPKDAEIKVDDAAQLLTKLTEVVQTSVVDRLQVIFKEGNVKGSSVYTCRCLFINFSVINCCTVNENEQFKKSNLNEFWFFKSLLCRFFLSLILNGCYSSLLIIKCKY